MDIYLGIHTARGFHYDVWKKITQEFKWEAYVIFGAYDVFCKVKNANLTNYIEEVFMPIKNMRVGDSRIVLGAEAHLVYKTIEGKENAKPNAFCLCLLGEQETTSYEDLLQHIVGIKGIIRASHVLGSYDVTCEICFKSLPDLQRITDDLHLQPSIYLTTTLICYVRTKDYKY